MVDPRRVEGFKKLVFTFPYQWQSGDFKLCTMSFSFGNVYVVGMGGSNYVRSKRGGGCEIGCVHFFS
jgi:hypothetical protein